MQRSRRRAHCLLDTLGCGLLALKYPACTKLLGADRAGDHRAQRRACARNELRTRSVTAAFNIGTLVRWLDFNDTWLAAEWGHPSDNLGAILAVADLVLVAADVQEPDLRPLQTSASITPAATPSTTSWSR